MNSAVIASLIGVALGASSSILAQYLVVRGQRRQIEVQRRDDRITYRRELVREFLEECQAAEARAVFRAQNGRAPEGASNDRLWYLQKYLNLIMPAIDKETIDYAHRLDKILWNGVPNRYANVWDALGGPRLRFLEAVGGFVRN